MAANNSVQKTVKKVLLSRKLKQQQTPPEEKSKLAGFLAQFLAVQEDLAQQYAGTRYKG